MREGLITSYHKSLIKRPLWSRSIIRSLIRQTIFLEKIKDQGNIKEVIRKCALEGCAFVANPWAVRFPGFFFFSSHWEFHEYRRVSPIFHPLWWFHAEFYVDGKRRYIHRGTIIFQNDYSCFDYNDIFAFDLVLRTYRWISFNNRIESNMTN